MNKDDFPLPQLTDQSTPSAVAFVHAHRCVRDLSLRGYSPRAARAALWAFVASYIAQGTAAEMAAHAASFLSMIDKARRDRCALEQEERNAEEE